MYVKGWLLGFKIGAGEIKDPPLNTLALGNATRLKMLVPSMKASTSELIADYLLGVRDGLKAWEVCGN